MASSNSSISFTSLDFDSYKREIKTYLKSQPYFQDYDFEASNMAVFIDVLALNTFQNGFYMNMIGNEMFLDSAQLRDSVVSHAKELNYVPRSFKSADALLSLQITSTDPLKKNITIPKGTGFVSRIGGNTFIFTTSENQVLTSNSSVFTGQVRVYEGDYITDSYVTSDRTSNRYTIQNKQVDLSSLKVVVVEDNGANTIEYTRATTLFDIDETDPVYFIQAAPNERYEVIFGDGIVGRKPKNDSAVIMEYRISNGELPNGSRTFRVAESIDGEANVVITTTSAASGGEVFESLDSIKFNAPRAFTTQERAVTAEDYENLLKLNYPEINAVSAFGGEDATPPQYGRIFISIDLNDVDGLPKIKEQQYVNFLRSRSTVSMDPIFISPDYTYMRVISAIKYNVNRTSLNPEDMRTLVLSAILSYADTSLNNFARIFRYSKFIKAIDDADPNIISNETEVQLAKYLSPSLNVNQKLLIDFKTPVSDDLPVIASEHPSGDQHAISSSPFVYNGIRCVLEDNGNGLLRIVTASGATHREMAVVGSVDYATGVVTVSNFNISAFDGTYFKVYARTNTKDIQSNKNVILNILESDVAITIEQVRE
jgi:hypothetical protein